MPTSCKFVKNPQFLFRNQIKHKDPINRDIDNDIDQEGDGD